MKRVLSFLPAAAAGLLAGWLVSKFFIHPPQPETGEQPSELARLIAGDAAPKSGAPEAWAALLAARGLLPLPPDDGGIRDGVYSLGNLRADHSFFTMHPARRELELELARFGLSEAALSKAGWPGFGSDAGLVETFGRLARKNPGRALAEVDRLEARSPGSDAESLSTARERIFREWVKQDPQAALRAAVDDTRVTSAAHRAERLGLVVNEWARLDPAAAAAALPSLTKDTPPFIRSRMTSEVLEHWYARDPAAARNWAAGTADPEERAALLAAADALAATTPAAKTAALLASPKADRFTLANTFADWLNAEPHAAVEKLASIPADDRFWQDSAADVAEWWVLNAHGEGNPEKYLEAIRAIPAGPQRETLLRGLADYGASNDIPFALRIISEMSEGRDRDQAVSSVAALWMRRDPVKTSEWLATLPMGSDSRNTGVACFAEGLATDDPERAAQWAASLPDSYNGKAEVMKTVLEKWRARDPAAAQAWTARP